jgi:Fic family protein
MKNPPFEITTPIFNASIQINHLLGTLDGLRLDKPQVKLRKENKIRTIQASLAIEGNTLSLAQVSDILEGARVIGLEKEILEVKNAIAAYDMFGSLNYASITALNKTHKAMMKGLADNAGQFRTKNVGVFTGPHITHVAPQPKMVPLLMTDLFSFLKQKDDISLLIKSCVFHYELEFIHPYTDGNGRMGRFWQHLILTAFHPIFEFVSIEGLIKSKQQAYYDVLAQCDHEGKSTHFIAFSLELIAEALQCYASNIQYQPKTPEDRLLYAKKFLPQLFTRKDYIALFKDISTATASRDLKTGVDIKLLVKSGDKRLTAYHFLLP